MKFKISEKFTSEFNKEAHYNKHKEKFKKISIDEYEHLADELAKKPVDNKRIFGYLSANTLGRNAYVKWDKDTELFVVYTWNKNHSEPLIISLYKKTFREYESEKWNKKYAYEGEIPTGD